MQSNNDKQVVLYKQKKTEYSIDPVCIKDVISDEAKIQNSQAV